MEREKLINEARRLVAASAENKFAQDRLAAAENRRKEAFDGLLTCEKLFAEALGLSLSPHLVPVAEALLLVAEKEIPEAPWLPHDVAKLEKEG